MPLTFLKDSMISENFFTSSEWWKSCSWYLLVERELVEGHGADEADVSGLAVEHHLFCVDPETGQLGKDVNDFVGLDVVNKDVWEPEVLHKLQVHGDEGGVIPTLFSLIVQIL